MGHTWSPFEDHKSGTGNLNSDTKGKQKVEAAAGRKGGIRDAPHLDVCMGFDERGN